MHSLRHPPTRPEMRHRLLFAAVSTLAALLVCAVAAAWFVRQLGPVEPETRCVERGVVLERGTVDQDLFLACLERRAQVFLTRDHAESKDMGKTFLTLLTAVLVASITFSEKIVDVSRAGWWARSAMAVCWVCLLLAIVTCGAGLALMTFAAGVASYQPTYDYYRFEESAFPLFISSGLAFGLALASLLTAGVISMAERHDPERAQRAEPVESRGPGTGRRHWL